MVKLNMTYLSSLNRAKTEQNVTLSGTPCPRHFTLTVPFGVGAPSGHVAQTWAIPPPLWGQLSSFCAWRSVMISSNLSITSQAACHGETEHDISVKFKPSKNRTKCHPLGYSVPPALHHHRTIWCWSTFGPRGPDLSNPTSFMRPALPMAPTTDNNARVERSVLRPNPVTFLRDLTLYLTTNYAIKRIRCLNYNSCIIVPLVTGVLLKGRWISAEIAKKKSWSLMG